jgi:2-desacetyl-2-hydroxyethyl bacteriochlorophyllide A dehydrogenase
MKALVYEGPREMKILDVPKPVIEPNEVLIQVVYSGICGSELSGFLGKNSLRKPPLIFGHEFSGRIVEVGEDVDKDQLYIGQRVTANPLVTCGQCDSCLQGKQQLCTHRKLLSAALPGSNAAYVKIPAPFVLPLPDHVSFELGALTEPVACGIRVVEQANVKPTDSVLIIGMGPIGLLILQVMRIHGVKSVFVADMNLDRLQMAKQYGGISLNPKEINVIEEIRRLTGGVNVAVDAVGASVTRNQCIESLAVGGRVIFTGLHEADSSLPINTIIRNEIECFGSFAYSSLNFKTALQLLADGRIGLSEGLVKAPLEEGNMWFERLLGNSENVSKVLLYPNED